MEMNSWGEHNMICGDSQEESPNMLPLSDQSLSRLETAKPEVERKIKSRANLCFILP